MKKITVSIISILCGLICFSQTYSFNEKWFNKTVETNYIIKSKLDTTVLSRGKDNCIHDFIKAFTKAKNFSCATLHNAAGCPDEWLHNNAICQKCLLHISVQEFRWVDTITLKNEYEELLKKIK